MNNFTNNDMDLHAALARLVGLLSLVFGLASTFQGLIYWMDSTMMGVVVLQMTAGIVGVCFSLLRHPANISKGTRGMVFLHGVSWTFSTLPVVLPIAGVLFREIIPMQAVVAVNALCLIFAGGFHLWYSK